MTSVLLVSAVQGLSARVPEVLAGHDLSITVIGTPSGPLLTSPFVDSYEVVAGSGQEFAITLAAEPSLLDRGADMTLFDSDQLIRDLADSDLPDDVKRRCLAASTDLGLASLGSKVGQQELAEAAGVRTPRTRIVRQRGDFLHAVHDVDAPALLKADLGGGGAWVRPMAHSRDVGAIEDLDSWLPLLVQEHIEGALISIEPLYRRGELLGYLYSEMLRTMGGARGPSTVRRFADPPCPEVTDMLTALGAAGGLHGFANITMIRERTTGRHYLIECDMHVNTWVQFGPRLGVDWGALLSGTDIDRPRTTRLGAHGTVIHLFPRELEAALVERRWAHLRPWLAREPGTWDTRNTADSAVGDAELASLVSPRAMARHVLMRPTQLLWNTLPTGLRATWESRGWKARGLRLFGIHL